MPPSPGDGPPPTHDSKGVGSLASVFKGLAGAAKLTKTSTTFAQSPTSPATHLQIAEQLDSLPTSRHSLSAKHSALFDQLKNASLNERAAAASSLRLVVAEHPLSPVLDIWYAAKDLIAAQNPDTVRDAGWQLLTACVKHPSSSDLERKEYFQTISVRAHASDFHSQLKALVNLTNHGRDISGFDYDVFPLLSSWLEKNFDQVRFARSNAKKSGSRSKGKSVVVKEEKDFSDLFAFVADVIKFNSILANDSAAEALVDVLLKICATTSTAEDIRACINILNSTITFGILPGSKLTECTTILSSIHCLVPNISKDAWHTMSILFRSHLGQATVRALLGILGGIPSLGDKKKDDVRAIRGSLSVLTKLVSKNSDKGYPLVPYSLLIDGLAKVADATTTWKIYLDILRLVNSLFSDARSGVRTMLTDEDWSLVFEVVLACSVGAITHLSKSSQTIASPQVSEEPECPEGLIAKELSRLVSRIENILTDKQGALIQRQDCIQFFTKIHPVLPDSTVLVILKYFRELRCCFPSDAQWRINLDVVLDAFFKDKKRSTEVRTQALLTITEVYDLLELIESETEPGFVLNLVKRLLSSTADETNVDVLQGIVTFAVNVATTTDFSLFCYIVDTLHGIVSGDRGRQAMPPFLTNTPPSEYSESKSRSGQTPANVVTKGFVQIFLRVMNSDVDKSILIFNSLISIMKVNKNDTDARLTAMKLLFRVRADWANRIFITTDFETTTLATTLYRKEATMANKGTAEVSQQARSTRNDSAIPSRPIRGMSFTQGHNAERAQVHRSASIAKIRTTAPQQLWSLPDREALPEPPSISASLVLLSSISDTNPEVAKAESQQALLPMGLWLETILQLIQYGCDWEVYSFILVHLPSQLSNHAVFDRAAPQLQELRRLICDQIKQNSFQEPPAATVLRKADVAICLFHMLTMILSYHRHCQFKKADEDDIVWTFVQGISTWERSAKCCIHALTICCHELPSSTSKTLIPILQRMAQIITQPHVAIHILEFLACLSRLPDLYVNFRKEEFQIVFGICFRYLQYVREKKQTHRTSSGNDAVHPVKVDSTPNTSDDLPEYVYTLAYHVVIFWFLALKLGDRSGHVQWITKNLFTDVDGSQVYDEQAQTAIDFMSRVTYADTNESAMDPLFTSDRFGQILKKQWVIGNCILTIEQAVTSGWAQVTKRQPSGTSSYMIRELFRPPPAHQQAIGDSRDSNLEGMNQVLPSHILVQVFGPVAQFKDVSKPIPLPSDESIDMAIRVFDRNSTVDGHKVGVIYIGENQTEEAEILANISGSIEYVEFLNGLGTLTKLKGATFNTQGLDRQFDTDGEFTFCWRDRVTELVFHVTTQMPTNLEHDPQCTQKKRHIGNDFVNIIFNDSGLPFKFDTFPSQFNYVNIVITPESRASFVATRQRTPKDVKDSFYRVQLMSKPGFPEISPASETKLLSLKALPHFIRLLALNASVFSLVWDNREGGENISSWGNRLREINRLRDKYAPKTGPYGPTPSPPGTAHSASNSVNGAGMQLDVSRPGNTMRDSISSSLSLRRSSVATFFTNSTEQNSHRSSMLSTTTTENTEMATTPTGGDKLSETMDFSKWA
ncbi:hypothetical protein F5Y16DRAFT_209998 [Xylariaceae sp. FL0255]|nr:hypothetical protein F5Y16DRAFT_209998 [Xylariaceae sp. FL0255]